MVKTDALELPGGRGRRVVGDFFQPLPLWPGEQGKDMAWPTQYLTGPNVEQILSEIFAIDVIDAGLDARLQKGELLTPQEIEKLFGTDMWEPYRLMHAKLAGMSAKEPDVSMQYHSFFVALYLELLGRHTGLAIPRDAVKAAMLHDIYEDVGLTVEGALRERDGVGNAFGAGVAETVWHLTNSFALALNAMPDYVLNFPAETSWVKNPGTLRDRFLERVHRGKAGLPMSSLPLQLRVLISPSCQQNPRELAFPVTL
ncbi:HD domain-containing protein [Candidatus Woesearchaeota archaeon]|nr:HD domain-containing protein [Candidatus Woesearchaeota archaeon]